VSIDPVHAVLTLYRERYRGFTARHFHDNLRQHRGFALGDPWTELRLQAAGLVPKAERRSEHRKKRARRPLRGMHQGHRGTAIPVAPAHALHSRVSPALAMLPAAAPGAVPTRARCALSRKMPLLPGLHPNQLLKRRRMPAAASLSAERWRHRLGQVADETMAGDEPPGSPEAPDTNSARL
jgi:hypothetical protein